MRRTIAERRSQAQKKNRHEQQVPITLLATQIQL